MLRRFTARLCRPMQISAHIIRRHPRLKKKNRGFKARYRFCIALFRHGNRYHGFCFVAWAVARLFSCFLLLFAVVTAYYADKGKRPPAFAVFCGALSLAGAGSFAVSNDEFLKLFMLIPTALLLPFMCAEFRAGFAAAAAAPKYSVTPQRAFLKHPPKISVPLWEGIAAFH